MVNTNRKSVAMMEEQAKAADDNVVALRILAVLLLAIGMVLVIFGTQHTLMSRNTSLSGAVLCAFAAATFGFAQGRSIRINDIRSMIDLARNFVAHDGRYLAISVYGVGGILEQGDAILRQSIQSITKLETLNAAFTVNMSGRRPYTVKVAFTYKNGCAASDYIGAVSSPEFLPRVSQELCQNLIKEAGVRFYQCMTSDRADAQFLATNVCNDFLTRYGCHVAELSVREFDQPFATATAA